jgi:uncharacterized DUF497 family protein
MVRYNWHDDKKLSNTQRHLLDFEDAWKVFENPYKVTLESARGDEVRFMDLAYVDEQLLVLVYTLRGDVVRVISYRRAKHPKETRLYDAARGW